MINMKRGWIGMGVLDTKQLTENMREGLVQRIQSLTDLDCIPTLYVLAIGADPAALSYLKRQQKTAESLHLNLHIHQAEASMSQEEAEALIHQWNHNDQIHGIMVLQPLPKHIDSSLIIACIDPCKDIEGLHPYNLGQCILNHPAPVPATADAVLRILKDRFVDLTGKNICIIGRSTIVGMPLSILCTHEHATVTLAHSKTKQLTELSKKADIIVVAVGKMHFLTQEMVSQNQTIIDVGIHVDDQEHLQGDVSPCVYNKVLQYTPVPGGVGPVTVLCLFKSLVDQTMIALKKRK